jgi:hypothetical protein
MADSNKHVNATRIGGKLDDENNVSANKDSAVPTREIEVVFQ